MSHEIFEISIGRIVDKKFFALLGGFVLFYLASLAGFFYPLIQIIMFFAAAGLMIFLAFWRFEWAILFLLAEFLFGQAGHFFEFPAQGWSASGGKNLSIRLILFLILMIVWIGRKIIKRERIEFFYSKAALFFFLFLLFVAAALIRGYIVNDHLLAIKDAVAYGYWLLILPLFEFLKKKENKVWLARLAAAAVVGVAIFTFLNLFLYANGIAQVHDPYYWWIRNVLVGKVTAMGAATAIAGQGFFRIVLPAHLWLIPALLIFLSLLLRTKNTGGQNFTAVKKCTLFGALLASAAILVNFSRTYFLSLIFGLLFLKISLSWRKWAIGFLLVLIILTLEFNFIYFLTTGQINGRQALIGRVQTISQPEEELSALTRLRILPDLTDKIVKNFWLGTGLGAQVKYIDPLDNQLKNTFHLDWGWLESLLELGFFGLLAYLLFLGQIFYQLWRKIKSPVGAAQRLTVGLAAGLLSLIFAALTGPYLFHPLGIFYQVLVISLI